MGKMIINKAKTMPIIVPIANGIPPLQYAFISAISSANALGIAKTKANVSIEANPNKKYPYTILNVFISVKLMQFR